ncbi:hypothetical protein D7T48_12135 [Stenotrophomonas maltophilia]|uniref:hypothetical protein n=1 Tax=Stenotrophomonas TaxID=40323 RepID=UPI0013DA4340|nr:MULTISPECIES: hypothetical protein [Stenotrophomonas]MBA0277538.1 hypothetical protein [Stenotrophomonas maltophilia]MBA0413011.1 hypothetical protein [Stenotrophomonas maltophilia]MBA0498683.1 hypothetical protein [Stenotrophomonas maltophilia]MBA0502823.1 hypothetical protein [Stenotrophomonas maltophilia]MBA0507724.1 hypothetical protein [Stenotrophomonas maltophilia]
MDDDQYEVAMTAVLSLAMALNHRKILDVEDYVTRLSLNSLFSKQSGENGKAALLDEHIQRLRQTFAERGETH